MRNNIATLLLLAAACAPAFALLENASVSVKVKPDAGYVSPLDLGNDLKPFIRAEVAKLRGLGGLYVGMIAVADGQVSDFEIARVQQGDNRLEVARTNPPRIFWLDMAITPQANGTDDVDGAMGTTEYTAPEIQPDGLRSSLRTNLVLNDDFVVIGAMTKEAVADTSPAGKGAVAQVGVGSANSGTAGGVSGSDAACARGRKADVGYFFIRVAGEGDPLHRGRVLAATPEW